MGDLFFPQLQSGALVQYPLKKVKITRTITNRLPSGELILSPDSEAERMIWQLGYSALSDVDLSALTGHFNACQGRFRAFTFIDPTDNMLTSSADLSASYWQCSQTITRLAGAPDPSGGALAFTATNTGNTAGEISQTVAVPAGYQYCFSVYAMSVEPAIVSLVRRGPSVQQMINATVGPQWTRIVSTGQLNDQGTSVTVAIGLQPGQQLSLYGIQLEGQLSPSSYCPTYQTGGVYQNAHYAMDSWAISVDGPNLYSAACSIETTL